MTLDGGSRVPHPSSAVWFSTAGLRAPEQIVCGAIQAVCKRFEGGQTNVERCALNVTYVVFGEPAEVCQIPLRIAARFAEPLQVGR